MKILIKNNRNELILETNEKDYENDIKRTDMNIWWCVKVEYHNGTCLHSDSGRRVVIVNGRSIFADWNMSIEGQRDVTCDLLDFLDIDFRTTQVDKELQKEEKAYKSYMFQTHMPSKIKPSVEKVSVLEELLDE